MGIKAHRREPAPVGYLYVQEVEIVDEKGKPFMATVYSHIKRLEYIALGVIPGTTERVNIAFESGEDTP